MTELPILFSGRLVRAILDGRKTQTRRPLRTQPADAREEHILRDSITYWLTNTHPRGHAPRSRYCQHGDLLYVRETWQTKCGDAGEDHLACVRYREGYDFMDGQMRWRPSIHMPKHFARLWLRVTDVRVERVRDIDDAGAVADGAEQVDNPFGEEDEMWKCWGDPDCDGECAGVLSARESFRTSWDSIYAKRGFGWDVNPWVWVVEFERCEAPR